MILQRVVGVVTSKFLMNFLNCVFNYTPQSFCHIENKNFCVNSTRFLKVKCIPFYPEYNSVSTIRIRLQKIIKCLGLLNILNWKYGVRSFTCDSQLLTSFNNYSQVSTKIYNTCGFFVDYCEFLWLLVITC